MGNEVSQSHHFPVSKGSVPVQVVRWSGQRVGGAFTGSASLLTLPAGSTLIEISATENCYLEFGDDSAEAETTIASNLSRLFLAGTQVAPVPLDGDGNPLTHVSVISAGANGVIQVEQVE